MDEDDILNLFDGLEPSRGGYGSEWECEVSSNGIRLKLIAEWLPRFQTPEVDITEIKDGVVTVFWDDTSWLGRNGDFTPAELAEDLASKC